MPQFSECTSARNMGLADDVCVGAVISQRIGHNVDVVLNLTALSITRDNIVNLPNLPSL
jgi:hypothetical protein